MLVRLIKWLNVANEILGLPFVNTNGEIELPNDVVITGSDSDLGLNNGEKLTFLLSDNITKTSAVNVDPTDTLILGESGIGGTNKTIVTCVAGGITQILAGANGIQIDDGVAKVISYTLKFNFFGKTRALSSAAQWAYASGLITGGATPVWGYQDGFGATITRNGAGDYSVTFAIAFTDTNYSPICTAHANNYNVSVINRAAAGFDIKVYNAAGTLTDADVGIVIFGKSY